MVNSSLAKKKYHWKTDFCSYASLAGLYVVLLLLILILIIILIILNMIAIPSPSTTELCPSGGGSSAGSSGEELVKKSGSFGLQSQPAFLARVPNETVVRLFSLLVSQPPVTILKRLLNEVSNVVASLANKVNKTKLG